MQPSCLARMVSLPRFLRKTEKYLEPGAPPSDGGSHTPPAPLRRLFRPR